MLPYYTSAMPPQNYVPQGHAQGMMPPQPVNMGNMGNYGPMGSPPMRNGMLPQAPPGNGASQMNQIPGNNQAASPPAAGAASRAAGGPKANEPKVEVTTYSQVVKVTYSNSPDQNHPYGRGINGLGPMPPPPGADPQPPQAPAQAKAATTSPPKPRARTNGAATRPPSTTGEGTEMAKQEHHDRSSTFTANPTIAKVGAGRRPWENLSIRNLDSDIAQEMELVRLEISRVVGSCLFNILIGVATYVWAYAGMFYVPDLPLGLFLLKELVINDFSLSWSAISGFGMVDWNGGAVRLRNELDWITGRVRVRFCQLISGLADAISAVVLVGFQIYSLDGVIAADVVAGPAAAFLPALAGAVCYSLSLMILNQSSCFDSLGRWFSMANPVPGGLGVLILLSIFFSIVDLLTLFSDLPDNSWSRRLLLSYSTPMAIGTVLATVSELSAEFWKHNITGSFTTLCRAAVVAIFVGTVRTFAKDCDVQRLCSSDCGGKQCYLAWGMFEVEESSGSGSCFVECELSALRLVPLLAGWLVIGVYAQSLASSVWYAALMHTKAQTQAVSNMGSRHVAEDGMSRVSV